MDPLRLLPFARMLPRRLSYGLPRAGSSLPLLVAAGIGLFAARPDLVQKLTQNPQNMGSSILLLVAVIGFLNAAARSFGAFIQLAFWGALVVFFGRGVIPLPNLNIPALSSALSRAEPTPEIDLPAVPRDDSPGEYVNFDSLDRERRGTRTEPVRAAAPQQAGVEFNDPSIADMFRRFDEDRSVRDSISNARSPFGDARTQPRRGSNTGGDSISALLGSLPSQLSPGSDSSLPDSAYFPPARNNRTGLEFLQRR